MNFNEMTEAVLKIFPGASFGDDYDGQIVIYTDMKFDPADEGYGLLDLVPLGDPWMAELDFPDKLG